MKRENLISVIKSVAIVIGFVLSAFHADADVFYWTGKTPDWHNPQNWSVNKRTSDKLPGPDDHIILSSLAHHRSITISSNVHVASLYVLDGRDYHLQGAKSTVLKIGGSFYFPGQSTIDGGLRIEFLEALPQSTFVFSKEAAPFLGFATRKEKPKSEDLARAKSGSCFFFTIVPNPTAPTCNGFDDGIAAVLEPVDGVGPFAYQWIGGPTTPVWNNRSAGTYTVIVTDLGQGGAPCNIDVFVNEPGPLTVFSMNATPPTCADGCDGSAAPLVIGGNGGYAYTWSSGESGFTASNLCATFTLSIEDNAGCQYDTTFVFINIPDQIVIDPTIEGVICNGDDNGAISIIASGGTGILTYSWAGPNGFADNTDNISNLEPGTYTITVEDESNCTVVESYDIVENPEIFLTPSQTNNLCAGDANGAITIAIAGGLPPYDFSWSGPGGFSSTDQNIQDLESGSYSLTLTDDAGCVVIQVVEITNPLPLAVDISSVDVPCNSEATGSASAAASGGTAPYNYAWTGPMGFMANGPNISGLIAGSYNVEVTDFNGCILLDVVNLNEPVEITATFTEVPITCTGDADGAIDMAVLGGTPPYTFLWSGPGGFSSTVQNISGLVEGNYSVAITDGNGCMYNTSYDLNDPLPLSAAGDVTHESCSTGGDGSVATVISGGAAPYSFSWVGPLGFTSTQQDISGLSAGTYDLTITDALGCSASFSFTVNPPLALTANFTTVNNVCFGDADGSITTTPTSGSAPYTYLWIGPGGFISNAQNISNLIAGEYSLQLTDANGCLSFFSVDILEAPQITISRVITPVTCFGGSNGAIAINVTGGTPGYTYQWIGPGGFSSTNEDISGLIAGAYEITVTDINGCTRTRVFTVPTPADYVVDAIISDVICAGDSDGAIDINVIVGTGPFSYAWTGPFGFNSTSQDISNIPAGSYTVVITGNLGCTKSATYEVGETSVITTVPVIVGVSCFGLTDGSIDLSVDGGIPPYNVAWTGPNGFSDTGNIIAGLEAGSYFAEITDGAGCVQGFEYEIVEPTEIIASFDLINPDCFGSFSGEIAAQLSGGTPPYNFDWTGPNGYTGSGADLSNLEAGDYELTGTDANGCTYIETVTLTNPLEITVSVDITDPTCLDTNGSANASGSGGTGLLTYTWLDAGNNVLSTNQLLENVGAGIYILEVTDENGCVVSETITLSDFTGTIDGLIGGVSCFGGADGFVDITVDGGLPPYDFDWSGPNAFSSTNEDISDLSAGTYTVVVTDANGCISNQLFEIIEPDEIVGTPDVTGFSCLANDGAIDLNITGGTPNYTISWTGPDGFIANGPNLTGLEAGVYEFSIQDENGCVAVGVAEMIEAPGIQVLETITNALCGSENTGSIETVISGGVAPYTIIWSGPNGFSADTENISDLEGGTYILEITDGSGCVESIQFDVLQPDPIEVVFDVVQPDCLVDNGSISATISGGTVASDYTLAWTDEAGNVLSTSNSISDLPPGIYTISVTDDNGCFIEEAFDLANPDISVSEDVNDISCFGGSDGAIIITLVQGLEPAIVSWSGPNGFMSDSFSISDLQTGIYEYTVQDANGCVVIGQIVLNEPDELAIAGVIQPACFGDSSGTVSLTITGGTPGYTATWTGPDGFADAGDLIENLFAGIYQVLVTDANGCEISEAFEVTENPELLADFSVVDLVCFDGNTGSISSAVSGGTAPYFLSWLGPDGFSASDADIFDLSAGDYSLTITDSIGCIRTFEVQIDQPDQIETSIEFESPGCASVGSPGSISLTASGGTPEYNVTWTGPNGFSSDLFNLEGLEAGEYSYSITDAQGCGPVTGLVELLDVIPLTFDPVLIDISCFGAGDGMIDLTVEGGLAPYSFSWTGPDGFSSDEMNIVNLEAGAYTVVVTDGAGCNFSADFDITEPQPLLVTIIETVDASCNTSLDGSVEVLVSGGTGAYTLNWTGPNGFTGSAALIENIGQGTYQLAVTDENGCSESIEATIGFILEVAADAGTDALICLGDMPDVLVGSGENADFFVWTSMDGDTLSEDAVLALSLSAGDYTFILIASNGICTDQDTVNITVPENPLVDAGPDLEVFAEEIFTLGGAPTSPSAVSYLWTPSAEGGFDPTISNPSGFVMETTLFSITVTDANGCQSRDSVLVSLIPELNITSGFTPNGDGINDTWVIDNMELFPSNVVSIFNRWGAVMYQTTRYNAGNAWDGTFEGNPVPAGTYYYTIELNDLRFPEPFTGPITIYR